MASGQRNARCGSVLVLAGAMSLGAGCDTPCDTTLCASTLLLRVRSATPWVDGSYDIELTHSQVAVQRVRCSLWSSSLACATTGEGQGFLGASAVLREGQLVGLDLAALATGEGTVSYHLTIVRGTARVVDTTGTASLHVAGEDRTCTDACAAGTVAVDAP